jgi:dihydroorotate dehydrogenase (NAD+) catalytic subunit
MADLSIEICGLRFSNPVLTAAGPPVRNGEAMVACAAGGAGGIVSKTVSVRPAVVPRPNMAQIYGGFLNTELWSELPVEQCLEREYALAKQTGLPLIVSLGYSAENIADLAPRVRPFADALELSTHYLGDDPRPMVDAVEAAKGAVEVPVFVKLSPFSDVAEAARAAAAAGADGLAAVNSFGPCLGLDVETARLLMGSRQGYGWLSGPALKPLALRCVFDIARAVDLPVIGVGGIRNGVDAIEFLMVGASAVGVCTAAILKGPAVFGRIAGQMERWLDDHGYGSPEELRGLAIRRWQQREYRTDPLPPTLDAEICNGCGLCQASCVYDAVHVIDGKAVLSPERCAGCGLCVTRCPTGALQLGGGDGA